MTRWILDPPEALASPYAGGKARALAGAERAGLPVPPWFVVSSLALENSLELDRRAAPGGSIDAAGTPRTLDTIALSDSVADELQQAVARLAPHGEWLAVRSSASDEDGELHSFAGQLESYLNVPPRDVADRVKDVWRSGFTERILAYRREHGLSPAPRPPAVLVQRMIAPRAAGVAFSADPISGRRGLAVVSAVFGLGSALVSGDADADTWVVDRARNIVEQRIVQKSRMHAPDPDARDGVRIAEVPADLATRPALEAEEVLAVADLARAAERHAGRPQDIEWALADRLYLLQSRPITSLAARPDPDGRLAIWDNSNIVESYSGVTTPLTFSFAREIYEHVYRQFCRMMGVPGRVVAERDEMFRNMLGLVRGRLYYNLLNWYLMLALLPGYRVNRRFMEQMMGVKEALPETVAEDIVASVKRGRALDALYLGRTTARLVANHLMLPRRIQAFYRRLEDALAPPFPPLEDRRPDELVAHYRDLRSRLLLNWDAPLVNDFFAMLFYGLLRRLVVHWCDDPGGTLQNDLIGGAGGILSAEPAVRMRRLASIAAENPPFSELLMRGTTDEILAAVESLPEFKAEYVAYLQKFGERTVNELKLESSTLHDDPLPLLRAVGSLVSSSRGTPAADVVIPSARPDLSPAAPMSADRLREQSRQRVAAALRGHPVRRAIFAWVLRNAKRTVSDRENLRLERTRLFGRVRRIFLEIGRRFHAIDVLDDPRDVLYLEVDEVLAYVDGRSTCTDLRTLASVRKREFQAYEAGPAPDDRFETRGPVYAGHDFRRQRNAEPEIGERRQGLGCCPGIVRGPVRIVTDPRTADLQRRAILVAAHTDPGWIMIFPSALGVIVERGSLLSHAAIVARELGIPAVVSIPGVTKWLKDDDWVELDGSTGIIRLVAAPAVAVRNA
jgi:pyruvate,water dikinase